MLKNPQVDICISNCLVTDLVSPQNIHTASRLGYYEAWKNEKTSCFSFSDVYMLIRKSSLSFLGLYDTQFSMMDWEYSLRCSFLKANIIYYTGYNSMAVNTPGNVTSLANKQTLKKEAQICAVKYNYKGDRSDISIYSEIKIAIGKAINYKKAIVPVNNNDHGNLPSDMEAVYNVLYNRLEEYNLGADFNFISK
jgi:hypothetical protein